MARDILDEEAAGSAIAAFTLAKMAFWHLLQQGLLEKSEAQRMLRRAIKANGEDGPGHKIAAAKLAAMLQSIEAYQPPQRR